MMVRRFIEWIYDILGINKVYLRIGDKDIIRSYRIPSNRFIFGRVNPIYGPEVMAIEIKSGPYNRKARINKGELLERLENILHADIEDGLKITSFYDIRRSWCGDIDTVESTLEIKSSKYKNKIELIYCTYRDGKIYGLPRFSTLDKKIMDQYIGLVKSMFIECDHPKYDRVLELSPTSEFKIVIYYYREELRLYEY